MAKRKDFVFSDKKIKSLKPKDRDYIKKETFGPALRIYPTGKKVWLSVYRFNGKRKWFRLGDYPHCDIDEARIRHHEAMAILEKGADPAQEKLLSKTEYREKLTVDDLINKYLNLHAKKKKRSWKIDERILTGEVLARWGGRKAENISKSDVFDLLDSYVMRGSPMMRNKVLAIIRKMFNFAIERDFIKKSPIGKIEMEKGTEKDRVLSENEIRKFWQLLSDDRLIMSDEVRRALKLILVTAQRPGECIGINRNEIDGHWWTIPPERAKNKREHKVYLTDMAIDLLRAAPKQKYFFESPRIGKAANYKPGLKPKPIDETAMPKALRRNYEAGLIEINKFTPHDLRRTATTEMAQLKISSDVLKKILNHYNKRDITLVYNKYAYEDEIQAGLMLWADRLQEIISGDVDENEKNG